MKRITKIVPIFLMLLAVAFKLPFRALFEVFSFIKKISKNFLVTIRNYFDFVFFWTPILFVIETGPFCMTATDSLKARFIGAWVNLFFGGAYDHYKKEVLSLRMSVRRYKTIAVGLMSITKIFANCIIYGYKISTGHHVDPAMFLLKVISVTVMAVITSFPSRRFFRWYTILIAFFPKLNRWVSDYNPVIQSKVTEYEKYGMPIYGFFIHIMWVPIWNKFSCTTLEYDKSHLEKLKAQG